MTTDNALRPLKLADYRGQPLLSARLRVLLDAARGRGERTLPHVLLHGPPGLGKTTLANIIANEMGAKARVAMGPGIEKPDDAYKLLQQVQAGDVLFIDEIHRLPGPIGEIFYTVMEDRTCYYPYQGHVCRIVLPPFTCIGATTHPGLLEQPMRERFGATLALEFYSNDDLAGILAANAAKLGLRCDPEALRMLASRARRTPRVANHLLREARDYCQVYGDGRLSIEAAQGSLTLNRIDVLGLNEEDRRLLTILRDVYGGGPTGSKALAATLGLTENHVADVIEPYLLRCGLVARTPRGRVLTERGKSHLLSVEPSRESLYDGAVLPRHDAA